jgi:hypothetical protein
LLRVLVSGALLLIDDAAFLVDRAKLFDCEADDLVGVSAFLVVDDALLFEGVVLLTLEKFVGLFCAVFRLVIEFWFARLVLCCDATLLRV